MILEEGLLYHIYNQGNNRQQIFFNRDNYLFFLKKINLHLLPHVDVLAWCLMPNHFHLMVYVRELIIRGATSSRTPNSQQDLNKSIGIMLASYTRAINIQENRTGSLFRDKTKAECITKIDEGITPSFNNSYAGTRINTHITEQAYQKICFDYIHQNPVTAGLTDLAEDWEFSSYRDYSGLRNGKLINKERAKEFGLFSF
ncbi:hypothetical protein [Parabacteroides sp. FAFU027]|uniref:hypothetical protein n=1 Tax=Parabacteroides sp. FAFU027 TaxID=2922715 RepID=UPI001FAF4365|nr:hypothetical protein [Parabacteroides sp. FAFU027]